MIKIFVDQIEFREKRDEFKKKAINIIENYRFKKTETLVYVFDTDVVDKSGEKHI